MNEYEFVDLFYTHPVQVKYRTAKEMTYKLGIAYADSLLDCETGILIPIKIITDAFNTLSDKESAVIELDWKPLHN